ncbi:MAG: DUF2752 domain-containing protein [Thermoguttaceae bacterium]
MTFFPTASTSEPAMNDRMARVCLLTALGTAALVALAALWWVDPAGLHLPLCQLHTMTGLHCPGCGAVRATHELLHGHLLSALHDNALWVAVLPVGMYAGLSEWRRRRWGRPLCGDLSRRRWPLVVLAVAAVLFFVLRNVPVYPFWLLAPPR